MNATNELALDNAVRKRSIIGSVNSAGGVSSEVQGATPKSIMTAGPAVGIFISFFCTTGALDTTLRTLANSGVCANLLGKNLSPHLEKPQALQ